MADCQLISNSAEIVRDLTRGERLALKVAKFRRRWMDLLLKLLSPAKVSRKLRRLLGRPAKVSLTVLPAGGASQQCEMAGPLDAPVKVAIPPLNLQPGERVRVKSYEQVQQTLDADDRYQGCTFTSAMTPFCGKTFVVLNRIERFFDERNGKLMRAKSMVILEGVHCHVPADSFQRFAGCDRRCYLFWKEAWLERISPEQEAA